MVNIRVVQRSESNRHTFRYWILSEQKSGCSLTVKSVLDCLSWCKAELLRGSDFDRCPCRGIATIALWTVGNLKFPEPSKRDLLPFRRRVGDRSENSINDFACVWLAELMFSGDTVRELTIVQWMYLEL